jgi:ABC-2 type transport system permease protein
VQDAMIKLDLLSLLLFVAISLVLFVVFVVVLNRSYVKISLKLQENSATGKYKAKKLVKSSVTSTLLKKELKTYFSIPVYIINSGFGMVLIAILTIASFFYSKEYILQAMQNNDLGGLSGNLYIMLLVIFVFTISLTNTTSSSVSLEGKNIDILKSLPVSAKQILNSKLYVNLIVIIPISIISIIVLGMKMGISSLQILTIAGVIVLMSITTSQFGLICNLLFPKLNFKAPVQVVKQGMSMTVAMLSMFALDVLLIMGYYFLSNMISIDVYSYIIMGIFLVAIITQNMILNKWGQKKFKKLSY